MSCFDSTLISHCSLTAVNDAMTITTPEQTMDEAFKRAGRLEPSIYVGPPTPEARFQFLNKYFHRVRRLYDEEDLRVLRVALVEWTTNFPGAALNDLRRSIELDCLDSRSGLVRFAVLHFSSVSGILLL